MRAGVDKAKTRVKKLCDKVMARDNREVEEEIEKEVSVEKVTTETIISSEMTEDAKDTIKKFVKDMSKAPAGKQLGVGAACGWISGYLAMKIGKAAATAVGGSLILLQIAHYKGYVKINWNQLTNDSQTIREQIQDKLSRNTQTGLQKFNEFASQNVYLASGYAGGFLIGMASS